MARTGAKQRVTVTVFHFAMSDLPSLLLASLNPASRREAEKRLDDFSKQQGFLTHLLRLILDGTKERQIRLAGSVYLKNIAKLRWEEVIYSVSNFYAS